MRVIAGGGDKEALGHLRKFIFSSDDFPATLDERARLSTWQDHFSAINAGTAISFDKERRFAARLHAVEHQPGFLGFELLRPIAGESRYFVYTKWESEEAFQAWSNGPAKEAHGGARAKPVGSGSSLLEFEVVQHA